jgi:hypothetical protein
MHTTYTHEPDEFDRAQKRGSRQNECGSQTGCHPPSPVGHGAYASILYLHRAVGNSAVAGLVEEWRRAQQEEESGGYPVSGDLARDIRAEQGRGSRLSSLCAALAGCRGNYQSTIALGGVAA